MIHHRTNETNPERCLVHMYKKYLDHRPETEETAFTKPKGKVWRTQKKTTVGHNTLAKTVGCVCQAGGINGYKTNHSLRVTMTTHLFQSGVDEQRIMDHTSNSRSENCSNFDANGSFSTDGAASKRWRYWWLTRFFSNVLLTPGRPRMMQTSMMTLTS